ncbi:MAG TPA: hypothetical protein VFR02_08240, partial [bacterium]|nr:hypothetical protein [bacterium]
TRTSTPTATPTITMTPSSTPTPAPVCTGSLSDPKLDLQVGCYQRDNQQERLHVKIVNWSSSPVTLAHLGIKMWVYESQLVNMQQWVQMGQLFQADGSVADNVSNTGFTASVAWLSQPCTVDATHKADQVVLFSPAGSSQAIPANGGHWDGGFDLALGRNNPQMDDNWADDYSKTGACSGVLAEDGHFGLYYDGDLLQEWTSASALDANTGAAPCCGGSGGFGSQMVHIGDGSTATPTPVVLVPILGKVEAAPNMTDGRAPVRFLFNLGQKARVTLALYAITGEEVYRTQVEGGAGDNSLVWKVDNQAGQTLASGLYFYILRVENGTTDLTRSGKIAVIK